MSLEIAFGNHAAELCSQEDLDPTYHTNSKLMYIGKLKLVYHIKGKGRKSHFTKGWTVSKSTN